VPGLNEQLKTSLVNEVKEQIKPENLFKRVVDYVKENPGKAVGMLMKALGKKLGLDETMQKGLKGLVDKGADVVKALLEGDFSKIKDVMTGDPKAKPPEPGIGEDIANVLKGMEKLGGFINKMMDKVPAGLKTVLNQFVGPVLSLLNVGQSMRSLYNTLRDEGERTIGNVAKAAMEVFGNLAGAAAIIPPPVKAVAMGLEKGADLAGTALDWAAKIPFRNPLNKKFDVPFTLPPLPAGR